MILKKTEEERSRLIIMKVIAPFILLLFFSFTISAFGFGKSSSSVSIFSGNLTNISQMQDVSTGGSAEGEALVYVSSTGKWTNTAISLSGASWAEVVNGTLATWEQVMNGTVSGGGITWANAINGTLFTTALFNTNYTANDLAYRNTTNNTYHAFNSSGLIKDWNATGLIRTWGEGSDTFIANYSTFLTHLTWANAINGTLMKSADWNATNTSYYLQSNPFVFYNVTTAPIYLNDTFRGTNYSTYLTHIDWSKVINGTVLKQTDFNTNYTGILGIDVNTNTSLKNWIDAQAYTSGGITWANAINGTLFTTALFNTNYTANDLAYRDKTNTSYYLASNPFGFYNSTTIPSYLTEETNWNANYSTYLTKPTWTTAMNGTLLSNNTDVYIKTTKFTETAGACDVTIVHSICSNSTGTYLVG